MKFSAMKKTKFAAAWIAAVCGMIGGLSPIARAEHSRVTNPNALVGEFLGRGLLYSVGFDRVINDDLVAGVGFGTVSMRTQGGSDAGVTTGLIPVYVNYYFAREAGSLFASVGADIVTNPNSISGLKSTFGDITFNNNAVLPIFGVGYENRSDSGFLFRVTAYGLVAQGFNAWGGMSLGYAF